jgi:hypothetical protein
MKLTRIAVLAAMTSSSIGCATTTIDVPPCPMPEPAAIADLVEMSARGEYPDALSWALDDVVPYCDGINAMRD